MFLHGPLALWVISSAGWLSRPDSPEFRSGLLRGLARMSVNPSEDFSLVGHWDVRSPAEELVSLTARIVRRIGFDC
jgi:hypothetical protein